MGTASADADARAPGARHRELIELLVSELTAIRERVVSLPRALAHELDGVHAAHRSSAENLLHYVALRQHDLREIQDGLASLGASSLGRAEGHVLDNVERVLELLHALAGREPPDWPPHEAIPGARGRALLRGHTDELLGPPPEGRGVRILVTLPSEAAANPALARELLGAGMDAARINAAHDSPEAWRAMIENVRAAERALGRRCRVLVDLPGPKVRTGGLAPGPQVVHLAPRRDSHGRVLERARAWLTRSDRPSPPPGPADATLPLLSTAIDQLQPGDRLRFRDTRGRKRALEVVADPGLGAGIWATCERTAYLVPGTRLRVRRRKENGAWIGRRKLELGSLPARVQPLVLETGDRLVLTADPAPGVPARRDAGGRVLEPARVPFTLPEILRSVREGHHVWLDDGKIGAVVAEASPEELVVEITQARPGGSKLGAEKGVNFPDTPLALDAISGRDVECLEFAVKNADLVGLSFVRSADDVRALQARLRALGRPDMGVVLKIETRQAFEQLPSILLATLATPASGVMIARGDLAVEVGYERLAELQEEILWMCEAAHVPVIWATQVLEGLATKGRVSRSEVTDAAMAERAECVMLNKGPWVVRAVRALDDILKRMEGHQHKKRPMLRALSIAQAFQPPPTS